MGLRNWITRPIKGHHIGVEDLTAGGSGIPVGKPHFIRNDPTACECVANPSDRR
jgi:hypothetical protein